MSSGRADRWVLVGLAAVALFARRDLLLAPATYFIDTVDYTSYFAWLHEYVGDRLRSGRLPLWNPYSYAGVPLAANPSVQVFYPFTWLHALLPVPLVHRLTVVAHTLAAGAFAFLFFRRLRLPRAPAAAGALPWMLGSYLTANAKMGHVPMLCTAAWIPLILLLYERAAFGGRLRDHVLPGAALGAQILAGEAQNSLYTVVIVAVYGLVRAGARPRAIGAWAVSFACMMTVAVLVAAAQIFPAVELAPHTDRARNTYEFVTSGSFAPSSFAGLLLPFGYRSTLFLVAGDPPRFVSTLTWEFALYSGVLTLVLALAAFGPRPPPPLRAAYVLLAVGVVMMLGGHTPVYKLLLAALPGLNYFRIPARAVVIVVWSLCMLAAYGLDGVLRESPSPWRGRWRFVALVMLGGLGAAWAAVVLGGVQRRTLWPDAVLPLTWTDAYTLRPFLWLALAAAFVAVLPRLRGRAVAWGAVALIAADLLTAQPEFPMSAHDPAGEAALQTLRASRRALAGELSRVDFAPRHVDPLAALHARVENVNGYYPVALARSFRYAHALRNRDHRTVARYYLGDALYEGPYPFERSLFGVVAATRTVAPGRFDVETRPAAVPRAWVVGQAELAPDPEYALRRVLAPGFDPRSVVVLEEPPGIALSGGSPPGRAAARRIDDAELEIETDTSAPGFLVLSEVHYPGWHATVDGQPVQLQRADYVLTALALPEGRHRVRYWYDPLSVRLGLILSGLSVAVILGIAAARALRSISWTQIK